MFLRKNNGYKCTSDVPVKNFALIVKNMCCRVIQNHRFNVVVVVVNSPNQSHIALMSYREVKNVIGNEQIQSF